MTTHIYCGDQRIDALDPGDRGLAYGDGVFETMLVHRGDAVWWSAHVARLALGCERLGIRLPDVGWLRIEVDAMAAGCARSVLKLIVTRGAGVRGYAATPDAPPTTVLALTGVPGPAPTDGLIVRWCDAALALQPRLAGVKHLNRLEQVLARAEWSDASVHEGLQCDTSGRVVGATSANLFVLRGGRWLTPAVVDCGIAGVCRAWMLSDVANSAEALLTRADVESADAMILCNSVRGILPVATLGERRWSPHPRTIALRQQLGEAEPAFAVADTLHDAAEDA